MRMRDSAVPKLFVTLIPDVLLVLATLFLVLLWLECALDLMPYGLHSLFFFVSASGFFVPSLVYLGLLLAMPGSECAVKPSKSMMIGAILALASVPGGSYWWFVSDYFRERYLYLLLSLLFVIVPALAISFEKRIVNNGSSASLGEKSMVISGRILFLTYGISLLCYTIVIASSGILLPGVENDFAENLSLNLVFWFLLPVHSVALLAYTVAHGRNGISRRPFTMRIALCLIIVLISFSGLVLVAGRLYGT